MEKLARAALALEARWRHLIDVVELVPLRSGIILALGHLLLRHVGAPKPAVSTVTTIADLLSHMAEEISVTG